MHIEIPDLEDCIKEASRSGWMQTVEIELNETVYRFVVIPMFKEISVRASIAGNAANRIAYMEKGVRDSTFKPATAEVGLVSTLNLMEQRSRFQLSVTVMKLLDKYFPVDQSSDAWEKIIQKRKT